MTDRSIEQRVIKVFADFKKVPPEEINMDTTFEELGFDSLDGLNLVFELEEEFDLTIPDDRVADMRSVRQAVEGVSALLEAKEKCIVVNAEAVKAFKEQRAGKSAEASSETAPADDPAA